MAHGVDGAAVFGWWGSLTNGGAEFVVRAPQRAERLPQPALRRAAGPRCRAPRLLTDDVPSTRTPQPPHRLPELVCPSSPMVKE